jgi:Coenzyme PQQ synthesis protein D (PqqD)
MKISITSVLSISGKLVSATVGEDVVLFDCEQGKYFSTGAVGAEIMGLIDDGTGVGELLEKLSSIYAVDQATLERELLCFLQVMFEQGLVTAR